MIYIRYSLVVKLIIWKGDVMEIQSIKDKAFKKYGRVIEDFECMDILGVMEKTKTPEDVIYVASDKDLEACASAKQATYSLYGGMPIQIGYCNGHNKVLNALEYHRDSEINIAVTDLVLILGRQQDIEEDFIYDTAKAEAFLVPAGTVVEVYGTTLHYAPCHVADEGFKCVVILPKGTNTDFEKSTHTKEDQLLFARNKWLMAHPESGLDKDGAFIGLKGENLKLK